PASEAWEASILPMNYARTTIQRPQIGEQMTSLASDERETMPLSQVWPKIDVIVALQNPATATMTSAEQKASIS
ncbi:hypothetical protein, partial [Bifidobacterium sp.]|uniref:hypothetical protein n=1 Tax=Bifidobacterium sp. TaxID=41200 RepID=UPI0039EC9B4F